MRLDRSLPAITIFLMSCHMQLSLHLSPFLACSDDAHDATLKFQKFLRKKEL